MAEHLLLVAQRRAEPLRGQAQAHERGLLRSREHARLRAEEAVLAGGRRRRRRQLVHERHRLVEDGQLALYRPAHESAGHEQPVDLVGALEDPVHAGVTPVALGRVVLDVPGAPEDLDGLVDRVVQHLRAPHLEHRALDVVLLDAGQRLGGRGDAGEDAVDHARRAVDH